MSLTPVATHPQPEVLMQCEQTELPLEQCAAQAIAQSAETLHDCRPVPLLLNE